MERDKNKYTVIGFFEDERDVFYCHIEGDSTISATKEYVERFFPKDEEGNRGYGFCHMYIIGLLEGHHELHFLREANDYLVSAPQLLAGECG